MAVKSNLKALVVDDEQVIRDFLLRFLSLQRVEAEAVEDGFKAVEACKKGPFDIIFLDVRMPSMNGVETLRQLKNILPHAAYIMMTGYAVDDLLDEARNLGIVLSLRKPFEISKIKIFLDDFIKGKQFKHSFNILVCDDDRAVLDFFRRLLRDIQCEYVLVETGKEAIEALSRRDFDLIFTDIVLKDMSGLELYMKMRELKPEAEIVLMTGYAAKVQEDIDGLGIRRCLYKPFDLDKIFGEINRVKQDRGVR